MTAEQLTTIGTILKPKHLQGAVLIQLTDAMFDYLAANPTPQHLFLQRKGQKSQTPLPCFIEKLDWRGSEVVLKLEDTNNRNDAEQLRGASLWIESEKITPYLSTDKEQEWDFLMGYTLIDTNDAIIGTVSDLFYLPANPVAQVIVNGKEVLVPLHEDLVELLDETQKILVIDLPEGLIDLYLNDHNEAE
ncbi:MAG: 16S rRNA processing protein RimM [Sphingobacteriales bacterium]|nr:16S rRNA processing protein RimM [Sphingobacteriales bacterium]